VTWLIHICDMTHTYMWYASSGMLHRLLRQVTVLQPILARAKVEEAKVRGWNIYNSYMYVTWLIHIWIHFGAKKSQKGSWMCTYTHISQITSIHITHHIYNNSPRGDCRLKYCTSVVWVKIERLPGNTRNRLFTRSWKATVRLVHSWAVLMWCAMPSSLLSDVCVDVIV